MGVVLVLQGTGRGGAGQGGTYNETGISMKEISM